jgi:RecJ-like exonuclease
MQSVNECPDCDGKGYIISHVCKAPIRSQCERCLGHGIVDRLGVKNYRGQQVAKEMRVERLKELDEDIACYRHRIETLKARKLLIDGDIGVLEAKIVKLQGFKEKLVLKVS